MNPFSRTLCAVWLAAAAGVCAMPALAQIAAAEPPPTTSAESLDSLVARALDANPRIRASRARLDAARARVAPAGTRPDPMLVASFQNVPISRPGFGTDEMTMKMVGVSQTLPWPGKLPLARDAAAREADAAGAELDAARLTVRREVLDAYYELAFLDRALEIVERNRATLAAIIAAAEVRYGTGTGSQQDVLRARVEAARLGETASELQERRRAQAARLNAALDRPSETPVGGARVPARTARAAVADSASAIRFSSPALGSRAAGSPLPPLETLQDAAVAGNPEIRAHEAMLAAQAARVELARRAHLPDFDVSLQYGQRDGLRDMVSATVSVPLAIQHRRRQDAEAAGAAADLAALHAEHQEQANAVRAEVARLYGELERSRTQLALYVRAILPQAQASLSSATAAFQVGRAGLPTVLDAQSTLFTYETQYHWALSDFAQRLAELDRVVGREVLP
jgi:cobalt-zinc-cadmium efflux system outer membrane protein